MLAELKTTQPQAQEPAELSVAFLTPSLSREGGGVFEVERCLSHELSRLPGVNVDVYGTSDAGLTADVALWPPVRVHAYPYIGPPSFRYSPKLSDTFTECPADVGHLHALWMHTSIVMRRWSRIRKRPYVTTLHGMLDGWALQNSQWKKRLCGAIYERDCLAKASCIQAFTTNELASARAYGLKNPVCIIPNGVNLPDYDAPSDPHTKPRGNRRQLLYLGRIHPKKGLINLLQAWAQLNSQGFAPLREWELVVAGWDQAGHEAELKRLADHLGVAGDVRFIGPAFGEVKMQSYRSCDAFVLPSLSEGLPMVVLEAWAYGKPVLLTPPCNLPEGPNANAAISVAPDVRGISAGLAQLLELSDSEREQMGRRGLELVRRRFTWQQVAKEMFEVYRWLAGGGAAPSCVVQH